MGRPRWAAVKHGRDFSHMMYVSCLGMHILKLGCTSLVLGCCWLHRSDLQHERFPLSDLVTWVHWHEPQCHNQALHDEGMASRAMTALLRG